MPAIIVINATPTPTIIQQTLNAAALPPPALFALEGLPWTWIIAGFAFFALLVEFLYYYFESKEDERDEWLE